MSKTKLGVLISGGGTNLQAIIDACESGRLDAEIVLIVSNASKAYGLERGKNHGINTLVSRNDEQIRDAFKESGAELLVLAGYLRTVTPTLIDAYPDRIINIHPSLIPAFAGKGYYGIKVHEGVIKRGVQITGATTHLVNDELDEGRILRQESLRVHPEDTAETLQQRVLEIEHKILVETIQQMIGEI
ncbi:phosphoribosylglycinamide formyltransferase [Aerococcaceae bacterium DSM 111176]|nr:phosphoribosylglycinamide formyltransferase [Aerococcaceae bacterium DSM 111176]